MIYWSSCPKAKKKPQQNITMSRHNVQYSNENCHYMMAGSFTDFTCLLKSYQVETTGSSGNHCYLKHTHLKKTQKTSILKHAADAKVKNTTLALQKDLKVVSLRLRFFPSPTRIIIFSPAAAICKQHTERVGLQLAIVGRDWLRGLMDTWWAGNV